MIQVSTDDVVRRTGITYRRLDHWARLGWLQVPVTGKGKGSGREWPDKEIKAAILIDRISRSGVTAHTAAKVARLIVDHPSDKEKRSARIGTGIWLIVETEG